MFVLRLLRRLRSLLGPLWWYGGLWFAVSRLGDLVNVFTGVFLVPAFVPVERLGAVRPLLLLAGLATLPIVWLALPAEKYLSVFAERSEFGKARALLRDVLRAGAVLTAGLALLLTLFPHPLLLRLRLEDPSLLALVVLLGAVACLRPVLVAAARAFGLFDAVVLSGLPPPFVRCLALWLLLRVWPLRGFLTGQVLSDVAGLSVLAVALWRHGRRVAPVAASYRAHLGEILRYALPLLAYDLVTRLQPPVEALVIRQRLPELVSAADYLVQTLGMVPFYFGDAVTMFLFPLISVRHERGEPTGRLLFQTMGVSLMLGIGCAAALTLAAPWLFGLRADWHPALAYAPLVGVVALGRTARMVLNCFVLHEHACRRFGYLWHYLPILTLHTAGLFVLMGWGFFEHRLPAGLWHGVDAWPRLTLGFVAGWSAAWQGVALAAAAIHCWRRHRNGRAGRVEKLKDGKR